jgi:hypothetical protein
LLEASRVLQRCNELLLHLDGGWRPLRLRWQAWRYILQTNATAECKRGTMQWNEEPAAKLFSVEGGGSNQILLTSFIELKTILQNFFRKSLNIMNGLGLDSNTKKSSVIHRMQMKVKCTNFSDNAKLFHQPN